MHSVTENRPMTQGNRSLWVYAEEQNLDREGLLDLLVKTRIGAFVAMLIAAASGFVAGRIG